MDKKRIFIAVSKGTGEVMTGAKGQHAFGDAGSLRKSLGQQYWNRRKAEQKGVKVKDLYDIYAIDVEFVIEKGEKL